MKPKPSAQKIVTANKQASAGATTNKSTATLDAAKPETLKAETIEPPSAPKPEAEPKTAEPAKAKLARAGPGKAEPLTPEQKAPAPLRPSDRLGPGVWIQLAVHFEAEGGEAAWRTLSARHRGVLGGEAYAVKRIDLGRQGRYYRLLVGPYASREPAREKCARLKRAKVACFLVTQRGRVRGAPAAEAPKTVAPKPPATAVPAAAVKTRKPTTPRNAAVTATPAFVKQKPRPRRKAVKKKAGTSAAGKKRAADLPFQRSDSIPGVTK